MLPQDNFSFWIYFQLASQTQDGQSAKKVKDKYLSIPEAPEM